MPEKIKISAANEEEALVAGSKKLKTEEKKIDVKKISPGKKNIFGLYKELPEFELSVKEKELKEEDLEKKVLIAKENLRRILSYFNVSDYQEEFLLEENILKIKLKGKDLAFLVEEKGKVLNALQYILSLMTNFVFEKYLKIILDYENFREERNEKIKELVKKLIERVKEKEKPVTLEPMNSFERRVVHSFVSDFEGVYSKSIGKDPTRSVVIYPKKEDSLKETE